MAEIKTRPATPEYRDNWDHIFGAKQNRVATRIEAPGRPIHGMPVSVTEQEFVAGKTVYGHSLSSIRDA